MMGLGMMIGAGVFIGMGNAIGIAGPGGVVLTFALNGLIALFTAMSYAELSSAIPRAGGAYNFARVGFGRGTSFVAGWMEWFASSVAGSLYAITFAIYTLRYLNGLELLEWLPLSVGASQKLVAGIVAIFFIYINYRGASETGRVGAFFTFGQILFLLLIGVAGVVVVARDPSRLQNFIPFLPMGWGKLLITMGFTYVAFEGFEVIAQAGDEAIDPKKNLPKAMLYSVYIVTIIYVLVAFATMVSVKVGSGYLDGTLPWQWIGEHKEQGFGAAVEKLMPMASLLLTLAVIFASTSALNATIFSATRASYALGRDRMLPAGLAKISSTRKTPWVALAFTGVIVLVVAVLLPTKDVASSASIMFLFLFFLVNICVIKIRRSMGDELTYGFVMPFFPAFPLIAIVCQAVLAVWLVHMSPTAWIIAPAWILIGFVTYMAYSRSRAPAADHEVQVLEEEKAPAGHEYRIMVAMANPRNAVELVLNTHKLCGAKEAKVELIHMVPVPDQVPLSDADQYMHEGREAIAEAMLYLAPVASVGTTLRYCRNVARGIVSAAREKKADMLVMGWHGELRHRVFKLGSTIDPIIETAPCNVVIFKGCKNHKFKRVLVPIAGGPNGAFALEVASILADKNEGEITAITVAAAGSRFDIDAFIAQHQSRLHAPRERVHTRTIRSRQVAHAILKESDDYDMVVIGCTRQPLIYKVARRSVPEIVAGECTKPLVMVNAATGIRSWIKRWV
ncbi:MAG: amino acid permease [Planctomycetes bacterium]|nr:amino acid permease [Planctomycetota bacterium]